VTRLLEAAACLSGALVALGVAVALVVEALAVGWGAVPPLSDLVASQTLSHERATMVAVLLVGVLLGALITHFTAWRP
jgi:heme/copper-type cytochrome/quinol oxidase subunit 1